MEYDFKLINEFCTELGFKSVIYSGDWLEVELGEDAFLCFQNSEIAADCLIGFRDTPWHYHDDLYLDDGRGHFAQLHYLDVLAGLKTGEMLIGELFVNDQIQDRWLIHRKFNDEFGHVDKGEKIIVYRASLTLNQVDNKNS